MTYKKLQRSRAHLSPIVNESVPWNLHAQWGTDSLLRCAGHIATDTHTHIRTHTHTHTTKYSEPHAFRLLSGRYCHENAGIHLDTGHNLRLSNPCMLTALDKFTILLDSVWFQSQTANELLKGWYGVGSSSRVSKLANHRLKSRVFTWSGKTDVSYRQPKQQLEGWCKLKIKWHKLTVRNVGSCASSIRSSCVRSI